ncbi:hypothetical protein ZTR_05753 [Talaromyces verruculosus]|nr:hypothetical protein ZTR_05753 [Talaromyces verruculosus]
MPSLPGFSDNPLRNRDDLIAAAVALVQPLHRYFSPGKASIQLAHSTGAHFDEGAARLEGFARPLWVVATLLNSLQHDGDRVRGARIESLAQPWIEGICTGTDQNHHEYWGTIQDGDQRMVEAEVIACALLFAPNHFFHSLDERYRANIVSWLRQMNGKWMPMNNWRWFRIFSNLALILVAGIPRMELQKEIDSDLAILDMFDIGEGWSSDGPWLTDEQEAEEKRESARTGRYDKIGIGRQADYYSGSFAIQFSQMLYSKFAADLDPMRADMYRQRSREYGAGFWRYFDANAKVPLYHSGALLLTVSPAGDTSLRWLSPKYPKCQHLYLQSELSRDSFFDIYVGGQGIPRKSFAPTQIAPDNTLALSKDGATTWSVKWKCSTAKYFSARIQQLGSIEEVTLAAQVTWSPWAHDGQVTVTTTLVPPTSRWPDWHVRVHRIRYNGRDKLSSLHLVEGGFAISRVPAGIARNLPLFLEKEDRDLFNESLGGASGIRASASTFTYGRRAMTEHEAMKPDSNTNLIAQRTLIPVANHEVLDLDSGDEIELVTAVFAVVAGGENDQTRSLRDRWMDFPKVHIQSPSIDQKNEDSLIVIPL